MSPKLPNQGWHPTEALFRLHKSYKLVLMGNHNELHQDSQGSIFIIKRKIVD
jgi:hypothetical protein